MTDSLKILLVDDDPAILRAVSRALKKEGHSVCLTGDARCALHYLQTDNDIDVILCDEDMPNMKGSELVEELKEKHSQHLSKFIYHTSSGTAEYGTYFKGMPAVPHKGDIDSINQAIHFVVTKGPEDGKVLFPRK